MRRTCFVIGPIGAHGSLEREHADALFNRIIKTTFDEHYPKYNVVRADHISKAAQEATQVQKWL